MIYIYNDYGGTHTTALAAAYHLKEIPQSERKLTKKEILNVNYFNKLTKNDSGKIIFHGIDENGDSVYTIGRKSSKLVVPALKYLSLLLQRFIVEHRQLPINNGKRRCFYLQGIRGRGSVPRL
jgi:hypothetical protein